MNNLQIICEHFYLLNLLAVAMKVSQREHIYEQFVYKLRTVAIEPATNEKDLGVNFTSNLSWSEHVTICILRLVVN